MRGYFSLTSSVIVLSSGTTLRVDGCLHCTRTSRPVSSCPLRWEFHGFSGPFTRLWIGQWGFIGCAARRLEKLRASRPSTAYNNGFVVMETRTCLSEALYTPDDFYRVKSVSANL